MAKKGEKAESSSRESSRDADVDATTGSENRTDMTDTDEDTKKDM